jgi:hypothetical protein
LSDKDPKPLIRFFCIYPEFLRLLLERQADFIDLFTRAIKDHLEMPTHEALLGCFDMRFAEEPDITAALHSAGNGG